jgi:hypothetical protein
VVDGPVLKYFKLCGVEENKPVWIYIELKEIKIFGGWAGDYWRTKYQLTF